MQSFFFFIIALAILIVVHEFGHFWVARRCGVKVLKFSVGFGPALWRKIDSKGTEYAIAAIPLGGYVKMLDEREGEVEHAERDQAFNRKSLSQRFAIVAAGPIANLLFAVVAYWLVFVIGINGLKPFIGDVLENTPAYHAGLLPGDEIVAVNNETTPIWSQVMRQLWLDVSEDKTIQITVNSGGIMLDKSLSLPPISTEQNNQLLSIIGIQPLQPEIEPIIGEVLKGEAADKAGLKAADRLLSVDGRELNDWMQWVRLVQASPAKTLRVEVERSGELLMVDLTPSLSEQGQGRIGASVNTSHAVIPDYMQAESRLDPFSAVVAAVDKTISFSYLTVKSLVGVVMGHVSLDNLGGPISIAQIAGASASNGFVSFINFLAVISISLGILNLLPIPVLDGGHLVLYLIEWVKGSPVSEEMQLAGQKAGIFILLFIMILAFFNDLTRVFG
jgi:regulator of sigma E protease